MPLPLDDVPPDEAEALAQLSTLDDATLWREAQAYLSAAQQTELEDLLVRQSAGKLDEEEQARLQALQAEYGRLLVRKSHAWLLLARRGYKVPMQNTAPASTTTCTPCCKRPNPATASAPP